MSEGMYTRRPVRPDGQFYRNQRRMRLTRSTLQRVSQARRSPWARAAAVCLFIAIAYGLYGTILGHHPLWVKLAAGGAGAGFLICLAMTTGRR